MVAIKMKTKHGLFKGLEQVVEDIAYILADFFKNRAIPKKYLWVLDVIYYHLQNMYPVIEYTLNVC
jgi:hypothetical protein